MGLDFGCLKERKREGWKGRYVQRSTDNITEVNMNFSQTVRQIYPTVKLTQRQTDRQRQREING